MSKDIDALSVCETYYNKSIVFRCGGDEGQCTASYTKFGQTVSIQCSGKEVLYATINNKYGIPTLTKIY